MHKSAFVVKCMLCPFRWYELFILRGSCRKKLETHCISNGLKRKWCIQPPNSIRNKVKLTNISCEHNKTRKCSCVAL